MAPDRSKRTAVSCSLTGANRQASASLVAFLTNTRRQTAIKHSHQARHQIRKDCMSRNNEIDRNGHDEIRTATPARGQNFSRRSVHGNGGERNFERPTKPAVLGGVIALKLSVHIRT